MSVTDAVRPQTPPESPGRGRIAIVGGGLAGISAALACAQAGAEVVLLECRPRLGGAAYSFDRDGISIDNGQHVFLRCCTAYRELLSELGALDRMTLQPRLEIPVLAPGARTAYLRRSGLPAPLHLAGALLRYSPMSVRERLGVARAAQALGRVDFDDPANDARTFGDWLREHGQSPTAIEAMWDLVARPTLNLVADQASLAQAAQVFQTGLLRDVDAADIGYARAPLSEVHDVAARHALARAGVQVNLRWRAAAILPEATGGFRIEASGAPSLTAEVVVVAVPHDRAAGLLPAGALADPRQLAALGHSAIVNLHVFYDRRVLEHDFAAGVRSPVQYVFDRTATSGVSDGQYLAVSLSAAEAERAMSVEALQQRYVPALAELLPAARGAQVTRFLVTREHAATFRAAPGQRALRPGPRTRLSGLLLAGAWTDTGWPATMEGAVRSGQTAAREALQTLAGARAAAMAVAA